MRSDFITEMRSTGMATWGAGRWVTMCEGRSTKEIWGKKGVAL